MLPLLDLCSPSRGIHVLGCCPREKPLPECGPVVSGVKGIVVLNADCSGLSMCSLPVHMMTKWLSCPPSL